ncbi:hypothetical protein ADL25_41000 [Streptomyces sp. NRRL F-5122]|nr:hypothetical protein ADL25_41000 [Streptomyces sp. NRRL F-5122]
MERRAKAAGGKLSSSAAQRIVTRQQIPSSREQLVAFLQVCEVPENDHPEWVQAWTRVRRHHAAELSASKLVLDRQEAQVAGSPSGRVTAEQAAQLLSVAGYAAAERYRGYVEPWTVRCQLCTAVKRIRLADLVGGRIKQCTQCHIRAEHAVSEVWAALFEQRGWVEYGMPAAEAELFRHCRVASVERQQSRLHITVEAPSHIFAMAGLQSGAGADAWESLITKAVHERLDTVTEVVYVTYTEQLN